MLELISTDLPINLIKNRRLYRAVIFLFISTLFVHSALAEDKPHIADVKLRYLSTQQGLSQDSVFALEFDDKGFLYIATENGINRWDGYHVSQIYGPNNEIKDTAIDALLHKNGKLFIGTRYRGVYSLDTRTSELISIVDAPTPKGANLAQSALAFSPLTDNKIIIAFDANIIEYDSEENSSIVVYSLAESARQQGHGIRWVEAYSQYLFIGRSNGLTIIAPDGSEADIDFLPANNNNPDSNNVKHLLVDNDEQVWISTVAGLYVTNMQDVHNHFANTDPLKARLALENRNVWRVTEGSENVLWLGTDRGLYRATKSADVISFEFMFEPSRDYEALSHKDIKDIAVDPAGNLWLGTDSAGALYWSVISEYFYTLKNSTQSVETKNLLTHNGIWTMTEGESRTLWIGTENGVNQWDRKTGETKGWFDKSETYRYNGNYISNMYTLHDKSILLESGDGLWQLDPKSKSRKRLNALSANDQAILDGYVFGTNTDHKGRVWFGNGESGSFNRYDPTTLDLTIVPIKDKLSFRTFSSFLGSSEHYNNKMLIGAVGSAWLIDTESFAMQQIHTIPQTHADLGIYLGGWAIDQQQTLWLSYVGYGVVGLDVTTFEPKYLFNKENMLSTDVVYGVQLDSLDNLWISSADGLYRIDQTRRQVRHFQYGEALSISEFNENVHTLLSDGTLVFGSPSGLLYFDPVEIEHFIQAIESQSDNKQIGMTITSVEISTQANKIPQVSLSDEAINLKHNDYGIQIRFSNMKFGRGSSTWFHYKLMRGSDVISEQDTQQPIVNIPVLDPGKYQFLVHERDANLNHAGTTAKLAINVAYAPWASPLAYTAYLLVFMITAAIGLRRRKLQISKLNSARFRSIMFGEAFQQTRDCVVLLDANKQAFASNVAFDNTFGITEEIKLRDAWCALLDATPALRQCVDSQLLKLQSSHTAKDDLHLALKPDVNHDFLVKSSLVDASKFGEGTLYMIIFSDISEQKHTERMLTQLATHDKLTGLANRHLLMDRLEHAIQHADLHNRKLAVMFIDLDRFKAINDSLGHNMGDALLSELSNRLSDFCPKDMTLARVGGDEFVAVAEEIDDINAVASLAQQLISLIEQPMTSGNEILRVSCSIGTAIFPDDSKEPDLLLRYADMAMYSAKRNGVAPFCFYTKNMNDAANARLKLENLVKHAYETNSFYNVYQPIIDINNAETAGFEMLMRCNLDGQQLMPSEFIPALEQLRLIVDATKRSVLNAIEELAKWYQQGFNGYISINLSALHFTDDIDVQFFVDCLTEKGLPRSSLRFEVTENVLMNDTEQTLAQFNKLNEQGFVLALDDFGTGYSSLSYLRKFPLDVLKIDKSFCDDIGASQRSNGLVESTIELARSLSISCIAEGVETSEQVEFLRANGCSMLQGFFFSKPVEAEEALKLSNHLWQR